MDFNYYLSQLNIPKPSQIYLFPTSSGKFVISEADKENFTQVYNTPIMHRGIGNGELSIKYLFSSTKSNHGGSNSDFLINKKSVEVKSYPKHFSKMGLGKFKNDIDSRYVLNSIFAYHNTTLRYPNYFSEVSFNIDDIKTSYETLLSTKIDSKTSDPILKNIYDKSMEVLSHISGSSIEELSKRLMLKITKNKLDVKPGNNNFVINITPKDPTDIYVFRIKTNILNGLSYDEWKSNVDVQSSEIKINFGLFS